MRSWKVKPPDVECTNCTLQVIQVMLDKPPYDPQDSGATSNDIYYACIDVMLKRPSGGAGPSDASVGSTDAGARPSAPQPANDAGNGGGEPGREQPSSGAMGRDAGSSSTDGGSRTRPVERRDAASESADDEADEHGDHEDGEEHEEEADAEDVGEGDDANGASPDGDGCSAQHRDASGVFPLALLLLAGISAPRRRT